MTPDKEKAPPGGQGQKTVCNRESDQILANTGGADYARKLNFGALPGDWQHWSAVAPLDDLLPVVSDPHAKKSPDSKIQGPGKTPSDFNRRGEMRGFEKWTDYHTTPADLEKWAADNRLGVCLQTRRIRAIDVDVDEHDEAVDIEQFLVDISRRRPPASTRSTQEK